MTDEFAHTPVLLPETIALLQPTAGGRYIDATVGGGGHAEVILELSSPNGTLLGIDADPDALEASARHLSRFGDRVTLTETYHDHLQDTAERVGFVPVDGILFDLGVSSPQLNQAQRGFSFQQDAPLDMRMGPSASLSAADIVNEWSATELQHIFSQYGEERFSRRVAQRIVDTRARSPILTTSQLAGVVASAKPRRANERIHPATQVFQALRIAVNDELDRLRRALPQAVEVLRAGGRIVVISFHSLEDRIVKQFLREQAVGCVCSPHVPVCICGRKASVHILTPRPITASQTEITMNPRARSAKMRAAERLQSEQSREGRGIR